jgi:hypothetical protein
VYLRVLYGYAPPGPIGETMDLKTALTNSVNSDKSAQSGILWRHPSYRVRVINALKGGPIDSPAFKASSSIGTRGIIKTDEVQELTLLPYPGDPIDPTRRHIIPAPELLFNARGAKSDVLKYDRSCPFFVDGHAVLRAINEDPWVCTLMVL